MICYRLPTHPHTFQCPCLGTRRQFYIRHTVVVGSDCMEGCQSQDIEGGILLDRSVFRTESCLKVVWEFSKLFGMFQSCLKVVWDFSKLFEVVLHSWKPDSDTDLRLSIFSGLGLPTHVQNLSIHNRSLHNIKMIYKSTGSTGMLSTERTRPAAPLVRSALRNRIRACPSDFSLSKGCFLIF